MLTVRNMGPTEGAPAGLVRRCPTCHRRIMWATAYLGRKLAFEPDAIPRQYDPDGTGWIPGPFTIDGKTRTVYAPLPLHSADKRRRASRVTLLHTCPESAAA